jgi:hypothetical protein
MRLEIAGKIVKKEKPNKKACNSATNVLKGRKGVACQALKNVDARWRGIEFKKKK